MDKSIILQSLDKNELSNIISQSIREELTIILAKSSKNNNDELLTRTEVCELLKIDASTLWHWTNKGKVNAYGIANRRYYKKSEILQALSKKVVNL